MSMSPVSSKFVLLSTSRSGTTALITGIGRHSDAFCHREIFLRDNSVRSEFIEHHDMRALRKDPIKFVDAIYSFSLGESCVGFKMWYNQSETAANYLMEDDRIKKILLDRPNRLASYSSGLIKNMTGVANARNDRKMEEARRAVKKLPFDREDFENFVRKRNSTHELYRTKSKGAILELSYSDINDTVFERIFPFLGIATEKVAIPQRKINSENILSRFDERYHTEINKCLRELGHPEWVSE